MCAIRLEFFLLERCVGLSELCVPRMSGVRSLFSVVELWVCLRLLSPVLEIRPFCFVIVFSCSAVCSYLKYSILILSLSGLMLFEVWDSFRCYSFSLHFLPLFLVFRIGDLWFFDYILHDCVVFVVSFLIRTSFPTKRYLHGHLSPLAAIWDMLL